jgi:primosomal protein N' (replication factor Y)
VEDQLHPVTSTLTFAEIAIPIAIPGTYTYSVPEEMIGQLAFGMQVEVPFGKGKRYAGLVVDIHRRAPESYSPKPLLSIISSRPLIHPPQFAFWKWVANYYACTLGEVVSAALPANLKLASETRIVLSPLFDHNFEGLSDKEYLIAEALSIQNELTLDDVRDILQQKTIYPIIHRLLDQKLIFLKEELKTKYKPKKIGCVRLQEPYLSQPDLLEEAFELAARSNRQVEALMAFIQLSKKKEYVRKQDIYQAANVDSGVLKALQKKGIFEIYEREVSRLGSYEDGVTDTSPLSELQKQALDGIQQEFEEKNVVLLHGVTGSGKTRIYVELIQETIRKGGQVLYLLPEIALTAQIIHRLQRVFGEEVGIYHSRLNNNERVELWNQVLDGKPILLAARSGLFLPFSNLQLIIIDEEHDTSYKQHDPSPRYQGRDSAIYLATQFNAKVLLGTATPAVDTYQNTQKNKYGLVNLIERYGGVQLPEILIADMKEGQKKKTTHSHFSALLLQHLEATLEAGEQAILFQNRRGYAPTLRCTTCGWHQECVHCDVSLTYHKFFNQLQCHYCGYKSNIPKTCPACGGFDLRLKGFGTEKIEDELKIFLPDARIGRMDFDTVRTKNAHAQIINDFEEGRLDILVGTQMVTKGLDFENVAIVGVLSADALWQFPDYRATEKAFQLLTQVAGRAGRKKKRGKVIIQTYQVDHPVIQEVLKHQYDTFFSREIMERQSFHYPPYTRLIQVTLKHKRPEIVNKGAQFYAQQLKSKLGDRVQGPAIPYISRVRGQYLLTILIKLERKPSVLIGTKRLLQATTAALHKQEKCSTIRVNIDVDPG